MTLWNADIEVRLTDAMEDDGIQLLGTLATLQVVNSPSGTVSVRVATDSSDPRDAILAALESAAVLLRSELR